jgi:TPP-dependent pyruvate/acetoin dehydrogenase alpha subunit
MAHALPTEDQDFGADTTVSADDLLDMYRTMRLITVTGERAAAEVQAGRLKSAFYPVRGL